MDPIAAIRGNLLRELIAALGAGAAGGGAAAGGKGPISAASPLAGGVEARLLALPHGTQITADVLPPATAGAVRWRIEGQVIALPAGTLPEAVATARPGQQIRLEVVRQGADVALRVVGAAPSPTEALPAQKAGLALDPATVPLRQLEARALTRQGSPAPLYQALAAVDASESAALQPLKPVVAALLAVRLDATRPITGESVREAIATLLTSGPATATGERPMPPAKALLQLLASLGPLAATLPNTRAGDTELTSTPPLRDAPPAGQRPLPSLPAMSPATLQEAQTLTAEIARRAEQASERLTLHQLQGLPEPRQATGEPPRPPVLSFELPLALGAQTAFAGVRIEREPQRHAPGDDPVTVWGVRFAVELDETGPVHAHLRLASGAGARAALPEISISLWAEDAATHAAFVAARPLLEAALAENALGVGEIAIFPNRPHPLPRLTGPGRLLDRAT